MCSTSRSEKGGMNSVIDQLMDHNWSKEYQFSYLATHISGNTLKKSIYFINSYIKLFYLLVRDKFDIIHIHMSYKGSFYRKYYISRLCKKYNKKVIIHLHGSEFKDFYNSGTGKLKEKIQKLFTIADTTIVLGNDWDKFLHNIVPQASVSVINNAIALPKFEPRVQHHPIRLLFMGALIKRKGIVDLISAVKNISDDSIEPFELWIAGTGEDEKKLKEFSKQCGVDEKVKFLGWINRDAKPQLLKETDVLVLPSYNEGLPIAILEAMSYGLPIISSDVGSISEAVEVGKSGYLFQPGNTDTLSQCLKQIISDERKYEEFSKNSRRIAEEKFSDTIFFSKVEALYKKLST